VWACDSWSNLVYPRSTPRTEYLRWYARCFNAVEGNGSFWAIPTPELTARWAESTDRQFRFAMKFPRAISHVGQLRECSAETEAFLKGLTPLRTAGCLGSCFLQLPPAFAVSELTVLQQYCERLPDWLSLAIEARHASFFDEGPQEARFVRWLGDRGYDRVLFDSRPLYQSPPRTAAEQISQGRKPRSPLRQTVTAARPFLRLIGRDDPLEVDQYFAEWAIRVAEWLNAGLQPQVFIHAPDDRFAPLLVRRFWEHHLAPRLSHPLTELPRPPAPLQQLTWFDD
jgi:uncharacterized protein YecE (DUF72 family)